MSEACAPRRMGFPRARSQRAACAFALSISSSSKRIAGTLNARAILASVRSLNSVPPSRRERASVAAARRSSRTAAGVHECAGSAFERRRERTGRALSRCRRSELARDAWPCVASLSVSSTCTARATAPSDLSAGSSSRSSRSSSPVRSTDAAPAAGCRASRSCICWWWFSRRSWRSRATRRTPSTESPVTSASCVRRSSLSVWLSFPSGGSRVGRRSRRRRRRAERGARGVPPFGGDGARAAAARRLDL